MRLHFGSAITLAILLAACGSTSSPAPGGALEPAAPAPAPVVEETPAEEAAPDPFEQFGDTLDKANVMPVEFTEIVAAPEAFRGKEVITNGTVRASCQKRGCWMEVRPDADRAGDSVTVRFKDYGFFMPLDAQGSQVTFQAFVRVTKLSKAQVDEMEAEGGTVVKNADGTATSIELTASGVEMRGRKVTTTKKK